MECGKKWVHGKDLQGFIYKNTTYVPLRFLTESMGKLVGWDDATSSIFVGEKPQHLPSTTDLLQVFPSNNPWNTDISAFPVHQNSQKYLEAIGLNTSVHADFGTEWQGAPIGIPYPIVNSDQPKVNVTFTDYSDESDPGPYPIPVNAPIEGGPDSYGDRHVIVVDKDNVLLYELFNARLTTEGWQASNGAKWDLKSNALRPKY